MSSIRKQESVAAEEHLDGITVNRTNLSEEALGAREVVGAYKSPARVERAFRSLKTVELVYEQVPGYAVPAMGAMTDLQRRAFEMLGLRPHPAPSLASPSAAGAPSAAAHA